MPSPSLLSGEARRALLQKCSCSFLHIRSRETQSEQHALQKQTLFERLLQPLVDRLERKPYRGPAVSQNLVGHIARRGKQLVERDYLIHQTPLQSDLRRYRLARQDHLQRSSLADQPRQTLRAAIARRYADLDFRLADAGVGAGDAQGAGQRQLASASQRKGMDGGDGRLAHLPGARDHRLTPPGTSLCLRRRVGIELADVGSGNKSFFSRTRDDHHAHVRVLLQFLPAAVHFIHGLSVERIQHLRAIDRHCSNPFADVNHQILVTHLPLPFTRPSHRLMAPRRQRPVLNLPRFDKCVPGPWARRGRNNRRNPCPPCARASQPAPAASTAPEEQTAARETLQTKYWQCNRSCRAL